MKIVNQGGKEKNAPKLMAYTVLKMYLKISSILMTVIF